MKRDYKGFTLAEILITLVIIGVVAALVLPSVTNDIQNYEYKVAWKKTYSDMDQAASKIRQANGGTFKGLCNNGDYDCLLSKFTPYFSYYYFYNYMNFAGFMTLNNGINITFQFYSKDCSNAGGSCASYIVNLPKGPDILGIDEFGGLILKDRIIPYGSVYDPKYNDASHPTNPAVNCNPQYMFKTAVNNNAQLGCSSKYLMQ